MPATATTVLPSTPSISPADAAASYERAAARLNGEVITIRGSLARDANNFVRLKADYQALTDAYLTFDETVRKIAFAPTAAAHAASLLQADATLRLTLQTAAYASSPAALDQYQNEVAAAASEVDAAVQVLRHDLSLPERSA